MMPKRFDTHFYLATAPADHIALTRLRIRGLSLDRADGGRARSELGKRTIIFPTLRNLEKLAEAKTVDEALRNANN